MRFGPLLMVALATLSAGAAQAERVGGSVALCRQVPSIRSHVVARLSPGTPVVVSERRSSWSRAASGGRACWMASHLLVDDAVAGTPSYLLGPGGTRSARAASTPRATSKHRATPMHRASLAFSRPRRSARAGRGRRTGAFAYGGSCPCGSGRICIGPRGGRYCLTSGGNKEYGQ